MFPPRRLRFLDPTVIPLQGGFNEFLLRAISCEVSWLIAVKTVPDSWAVLGCVVSELSSPLSSVSLSSAQVHWDCCVIEGPGGV